MRSHGLFLAAALALSDVISLAHGIPSKKNAEAAQKGSGNGSQTETKPAPEGSAPGGTPGPGGKHAPGGTPATETSPSAPPGCFSLHLKASGKIGNFQVNVDSDADLSHYDVHPSTYATPVFTASGKGANLIWRVEDHLAYARAGDVEMKLVTQKAIGFKGLLGLFLAPTSAKLARDYAVVSVTLGKDGSFNVNGLANVACATNVGEIGYAIGKPTAEGVQETCLSATVTTTAVPCAK